MEKNNKGLIIGIVVVAAIALVGLIIIGGSNKKSMSTGTTNSPSSSNSSKTSSTSDSSSAAANAVSIENYMFTPMAVKVKVGDTITWTNKDSVHHTVTADKTSNDAPNSPLFGKGETYSFKFTKAGTYTFHCNPHPYMHGTVEVTN
ncbi:MAG: hypothetical protein NVS1B10_02540 [Candidatus Saccharimonadales bacterium]